MDMFDFAGMLFGGSRTAPDATTVTATGAGASADGEVGITLDADVTPAEDTGVEGDEDQTIIDLPTSPDVDEGDEVIVTLVGDGPLKTPVVTANPGSGDRMRTLVNAAQTVADAAQKVAEAVNQHFFVDTNGIHVTEATQDEWDTDHTGANVLINSVGQLFRDGLNNLLTLTTESGARALTIWDGLGNSASNILARFSSDGISFADGTSFDIGDSSSYIHFDGNGHINIGGSGLTIGGYIPTGGVTVSDLTQAAQDATLNSNISVGGRNLIAGTGDWSGWRKTGANSGSATDDVWTFPAHSSLDWSGLSSALPHLALSDYDGATLTLGFDYRSDDFSDTSGEHWVNVSLQGCASSDATNRTRYRTLSHPTFDGRFVPTTDWQRGSITFSVSDSLFTAGSGTVTHFFITFYNYTLNSYQLRHVKLERGNKATDWAPAPEDQTAYVDDSISSIQVGGRNLLQDSKFTTAFGAGWWVLDGLSATLSDNKLVIDGSVAARGHKRIYQSPARFSHVKNTTYTFSCDIVATAACQVSFGRRYGTVNNYGVTFDVTTTSQRISGTYTSTSTVGAFCISGVSNSATVTISNPKLEIGNKATDWTPAPEDVDSAISDAAKTATSYVTDITGGGIMVHPSSVQNTGVKITSDVDILRDGYAVLNVGTQGDTSGNTDAGVTIYDGDGNESSNILARFTGNRIRLGKHIDDNEENDGAYVDFFDGDWFVNRLDSNVFVRDDPDDPARTLSLGMSTAIEGTFPGTKAFIDASFGASAQVYGDELGAHEQITRSSLSSGTSGRYSSTSMGVVTAETYEIVDGYQEMTDSSRQAYIRADELELTYDVGQLATTRTHSIEHVSIVLRSPIGTYTGTNTTATASAAGWQLTYFNTVVAEVGSPRTYDYTFSNGVLTAKRDCVLEISGVMNWTDAIAGNRGFGIFKGTTAGSGTEHSAFQNFPSTVSSRKSVVFPPKLFTLSAGDSLTFGRYQQASAVYQNGTNYSWVTIRVVG